jgi:hemerythrin
VPHKAQHDAYISKMKDLQKQATTGECGVPIAFMSFLQDWWTKHILSSDKEYSSFLKSKGAV